MRHLAAGILATCSLVACSATDDPSLAEREAAATVCADGPTTVPGIDVSRWQGQIDWDAVKASGVKFAIIRATNGTTIDDQTFAYNWKRAREVGIIRGVYEFFQADQDGVAQADHLLDVMGPLEPGDLPPMIDVEDVDSVSPGPATYVHMVHQFLDRIEAGTGARPTVYTGRWYWDPHLGGSTEFGAYPLVYAAYTTSCPNIPDGWDRWTIWQYSDHGNIGGIGGNVDLDRFNGDLTALQALTFQPAVCGDGLCAGGEDPDTCARDCAPCQTVAADAATVIDESSSCFAAGGDPKYIRSEVAGYGGGLKWTHATSDAKAANFGEWTTYFARAGRYRVEAYTAAAFAQSHTASYQVSHAGTTDLVPVDQTAVDGWQVLGEFDFAAGWGAQGLRLDDNTGEALASNTQLVFDAVRVTPIEVPDGGGGGPGDPPPADGGVMAGGCQTGGGGSATAGLGPVLALALIRRRRISAARP